MSEQSSFGWRAIKALIGAAERSSARTLASEPLKRPIGVLTASQINTSPIDCLPECRGFRAERPELMASFRSAIAAGQFPLYRPLSPFRGRVGGGVPAQAPPPAEAIPPTPPPLRAPRTPPPPAGRRPCAWHT